LRVGTRTTTFNRFLPFAFSDQKKEKRITKQQQQQQQKVQWGATKSIPTEPISSDNKTQISYTRRKKALIMFNSIIIIIKNAHTNTLGVQTH
jgi:hypothetical protein